MASTFFGLNIAGSGLRAANAALNTAANNISNKDTEGYSRQRVVQQAADPLRAFATYGCSGAGVQTLAIERIRDEFYDTKYRENETSYGDYTTKNYYMQMVQNYFKDDGKTGFKSVFDNMKVLGIEEVLKNAGSATAKKDFVGTAEKLVEYFNTASKNLERLQKDINDEVKVRVEQINSISKEIQTLNKQINVVELAGSKANELRDKRDVLVDQLSQIVDVEVTESPIYDSNDPDRETGATRYMVRIAGGQMLVDNNMRFELECRARVANDKVNQSDIVGLYDIYWVGGDMFNSTNSQMGGALSALLKLRDGNNGENFRGTVVGNAQDKLDANGNVVIGKDGRPVQTVTVSVSAEHLTDLNKCTLAEAGTVNIGNTLYKYDGWTFTRDKDGNCSYTLTLAEGEHIDININEKNASTGSSIDYQGIPYYQEQMNEWLRLFSRSVNDILKSGYTDDGKPGCLMFTSDYPDSTEGKFDHTDAAGGNSVDLFSGDYKAGQSYTISCQDDTYFRMTAANFTILDAMKANPELLGVKKDPESDGESQYDNMKEVLDTLSDSSKLSFRGADAGEFLTCVLGDITLAAGSAETFEENYLVLRKSLENQRLSISGVDEDEEALSVVHLQDSYTLACKLISTFSEVYDRLILETGV
ncbi:flagellar hook-associated protein FlgK [bacterium 1XD8-76]|nr:flagellar hook-associated protein FlgK [bacterium 1XD8-76]